jgi:hypothetical protein
MKFLPILSGTTEVSLEWYTPMDTENSCQQQ